MHLFKRREFIQDGTMKRLRDLCSRLAGRGRTRYRAGHWYAANDQVHKFLRDADSCRQPDPHDRCRRIAASLHEIPRAALLFWDLICPDLQRGKPSLPSQRFNNRLPVCGAGIHCQHSKLPLHHDCYPLLRRRHNAQMP